MLVTIYKVLYPGIEQVNQYYKWKHEFPETKLVKENRAGPPKKIRGTTTCPGCGKTLSYSQIYTDQHKCPGTLTAHPVKPRGHKPGKPSKSELAQKWQQYVQDNDHPITFSESGETED